MSFERQRDVVRDKQDLVERHVWGSLEYVDGAGAVLQVRGTDTEDVEAPLLNTGYGFNVSQNYNTEVMLLSLGSDTNQKYAVASIPRDKQRRWEEGKGGIQHPTNPEMYVEFSDEGIHIHNGTVFLGPGTGVRLEVTDDTVNIICAKLQHNGVNIGDDHVHGGVERGGATTNGPQ